MHKSITIFWFKRDLRFQDNEALSAAMASKLPVLFVYILEPSLKTNPHYSKRHFNFIKESLSELKKEFELKKLNLLIVESEVLPFLKKVHTLFPIQTLFSTEESGLQITYDRDIEVQKFCVSNKIVWKQFQNNGVLRGRSNREDWRKLFYEYMSQPLSTTPWDKVEKLPDEQFQQLKNSASLVSLDTPKHSFQKGGRTKGEQWLQSFFEESIAFYSAYISKPELARYGCSRLSPYIAWGVFSVRELYQHAQQFKKSTVHKKQTAAFSSRLRWQSHFIQKFEMEMRMEYEAVNKGYLSLPYVYNKTFVTAWKEGKTGYPLVDAAMRCVVETGYLNFRMRAMVTSFLTHHLFQHFTTGSAWLAQQFLDFEPGIHYGQFQMQAGLTGINTVRVYNPTKNALDHDSEAIFIKKYVLELKELPAAFAIEPWKITALEQQLYNFNYGSDYPERIVDISETRKEALQKIYAQRKLATTQAESKRVLDTHTLHKTASRFP